MGKEIYTRKEREYLSQLKSVNDYTKKNELAVKVLQGIATGGFVAACLLAPNLAQVEKFFRDWQKEHKAKVRRICKKFLDNGYVVFIDDKPYLTAKGQVYLLRNVIKNYEINYLDSEGYTVIVFDVPEKKKELRDALRKKLRRDGFVQLQNSVLVYGGSCTDSLFEFFKILGVSEYVYVINAENICGDVDFPL